MLIVRAPVRVSLASGGTDFAAYWQHSGGLVLSTTIAKDHYAVLTPSHTPNAQVTCSQATSFLCHPNPGRADHAGELARAAQATLPPAARVGPARTVFLDRDGVINRHRAGYVTSWDEFEFLPGALRAIARLHARGYRLFVVTNQACVGKGLVSPEVIDEIHRRMSEAIHQAGGHIEAVLYCPHHPEAGCECRKPRAGLLLRARDEYGVDLAHATLIGDSAGDLQAASAVGVPGVLVLSGLGWHTALSASSWMPSWAAFALNLDHASRLLHSPPLLHQAQQLALRCVVHGARALARVRHGGASPASPEGKRMDPRVATSVSGASTQLGGRDA